jgi:hypothetical protein
MKEQVLLFVNRYVQSSNNGDDKNKVIIFLEIFIENYYCISDANVVNFLYPN